MDSGTPSSQTPSNVVFVEVCAGKGKLSNLPPLALVGTLLTASNICGGLCQKGGDVASPSSMDRVCVGKV